VRAAGYDPDTQTLDVEFNGGEITRFSGVHKVRFEELIAANDSPKIESALANIRRRATSAEKVLTPLQQLPVAERQAESALIDNFGEKGTALRAEYEEIQRRLLAMPVIKSRDELKEIQAKLAAVNPRSDVDEIAALLNREAALLRIIDTSKPELAQLYSQLEALQQQQRHQKAFAAANELKNQQIAEQKRARLAELERQINDPNFPPMTPELLRSPMVHRDPNGGYDAYSVRRIAKDALRRERDKLSGQSHEVLMKETMGAD
jgi:hypothetical protein